MTAMLLEKMGNEKVHFIGKDIEVPPLRVVRAR